MAWIALVGPEIEENLGLRYLASSLIAAGFESRILPFNAPADLPRVVEEVRRAGEPPLVVAVSLAFQWRALDCLSLGLALRDAGYQGHLTGGGHFGSFAWQPLLAEFPEFDSLCRHEAEETLVALAMALRDGTPLEEVGGLALRPADGEAFLTPPRPPPDVARLPWPDRRGEPTSCLGHRIAAMVASRGCYARCAFCCIAAWHEQAAPGKRWRLRPVEDVADEMASLFSERRVDVFIFHDDDFFLPKEQASLERIEALGDALSARRVGPIATVVKARPNDLSFPIVQAMRHRLGLTRVFLGVETNAERGLETLERRVESRQNREAMELLERLGVYTCFNLLAFDPDTTVEDMEANLAFMERWGESPLNFGRVELYWGTPLLERMQREGRTRGDWLGWDYPLANPEIQAVFDLALRCFYPRNFAAGALANRLMGTRFDVEICRRFHPEVFEAAWLVEAKALSFALARDSAGGLRSIVSAVREGKDQDAFADRLASGLRATEASLRERAASLEQRVQRAVGRGCEHVLRRAAVHSVLLETKEEAP